MFFAEISKRVRDFSQVSGVINIRYDSPDTSISCRSSTSCSSGFITGSGYNLWLSTDAPDLDIFVYLEEVDRKGHSTYISEGNLLASHRTQSPAPYDKLGLPHHSHRESDLEPIRAGEPFEMVFDLLPTSYLFRAGNRIRIAIAFADSDNFDTPVLDPPPTVKLMRSLRQPTYVELPVNKNL